MISEQHKDYLTDNGWKVDEDNALFTNKNKKLFGLYPESQDRYLITNIRDITSNKPIDLSETFVYYNKQNRLEDWFPNVNELINKL